jgi:hypothetical protein
MTDFRQFTFPNIGQIKDTALRTILTLFGQGKLNIVETVTLDANAASTTLEDELITEASQVVLTPETANAAAALATTYLPRADYSTGQVVIRHANNAQVDKTFTYSVIG